MKEIYRKYKDGDYEELVNQSWEFDKIFSP